MILLFLSCQDPIHLPCRPDFALLQLVPGLGLADRGGWLVGRYPGVDPLRPRPERARDDRLDRNRLVLGIRIKVYAARSMLGIDTGIKLTCLKLAMNLFGLGTVVVTK